MGSINDYLHKRRAEERPARSRFANRFLGQISLSLILFLLVAASIGAEGIFGESARYVAGEGLAAEGSWIDLSRDDNVVAVDGQIDTTIPQTDTSPADDSQPPAFTAPASGIVVTDIAVASEGFTTTQGILIQGNGGQTVKAAAKGTVLYMGDSSDGYLLQVQHSGGFISVYQGLSELKVAMGDTVSAGQELGITQSGELTFSLLLNETEVDPLEYLFQ